MNESTDRDIAAYDERRATLRAMGIEIPDLYGTDDDSTGNLAYWRRMAAETEARRIEERETQRQVEAMESWLPRREH